MSRMVSYAQNREDVLLARVLLETGQQEEANSRLTVLVAPADNRCARVTVRRTTRPSSPARASSATASTTTVTASPTSSSRCSSTPTR